MTSGDDVQVVTFRIAGQEFAFNIFHVERILRYEAPVRLPDAPAFLEGVLRYRDGTIPVVDLRKRLRVEAPNREETRVIVLEWDPGRIGVVVDTVTEVLRVPAEVVAPPPEYVRGLAAKYVAGIIALDGRTIVLLHPRRLLTSKERLALEALATSA